MFENVWLWVADLANVWLNVWFSGKPMAKVCQSVWCKSHTYASVCLFRADLANVWLNNIYVYGFLFQPLYPKSRTLNHFHHTRRKKALTSHYASAHNQRPWV